MECEHYIAWQEGHVNQERELLRLARMFLNRNSPVKAGILITEEFKKGRIQTSEQSLKLLYHSWNQAKEREKALTVLRELTRISKNGKYSLWLTQKELEEKKSVFYFNR